jgi:TetR/AcrR family transcriptional repressor of nem operon
MGRKRAFDEQSVLANAMMAFREHGFGGLSVKQLEAATGLSVGSLYNAYGDKEGLYAAVFEFYFGLVIDPRLGAARTLEDLECVLLDLFQPPFTDGFGCMVTNAAIEFRSEPSPASRFVTRGLDAVENAARRVVEAELGRAGDAALRIVLLYQGMLVLTRAGRLTDDYSAVVRGEFDRLKALRNRVSSEEEK